MTDKNIALRDVKKYVLFIRMALLFHLMLLLYLKNNSSVMAKADYTMKGGREREGVRERA
jgi:hypothetical protein